jgi:hypothetical protein
MLVHQSCPKLTPIVWPFSRRKPVRKSVSAPVRPQAVPVVAPKPAQQPAPPPLAAIYGENLLRNPTGADGLSLWTDTLTFAPQTRNEVGGRGLACLQPHEIEPQDGVFRSDPVAAGRGQLLEFSGFADFWDVAASSMRISVRAIGANGVALADVAELVCTESRYGEFALKGITPAGTSGVQVCFAYSGVSSPGSRNTLIYGLKLRQVLTAAT